MQLQARFEVCPANIKVFCGDPWGGSCHATANGDAAAAQKGAIAKVARQRKIAKVAQLVLNASVYGAGMTCMMIIQYWLVVSTPLKNISQLGLLFPIYGKINTVPNHQPE